RKWYGPATSRRSYRRVNPRLAEREQSAAVPAEECFGTSSGDVGAVIVDQTELHQNRDLSTPPMMARGEPSMRVEVKPLQADRIETCSLPPGACTLTVVPPTCSPIRLDRGVCRPGPTYSTMCRADGVEYVDLAAAHQRDRVAVNNPGA